MTSAHRCCTSASRLSNWFMHQWCWFSTFFYQTLRRMWSHGYLSLALWFSGKPIFSSNFIVRLRPRFLCMLVQVLLGSWLSSSPSSSVSLPHHPRHKSHQSVPRTAMPRQHRKEHHYCNHRSQVQGYRVRGLRCRGTRARMGIRRSVRQRKSKFID